MIRSNSQNFACVHTCVCVFIQGHYLGQQSTQSKQSTLRSCFMEWGAICPGPWTQEKQHFTCNTFLAHWVVYSLIYWHILDVKCEKSINLTSRAAYYTQLTRHIELQVIYSCYTVVIHGNGSFWKLEQRNLEKKVLDGVLLIFLHEGGLESQPSSTRG